MRDDCTDPINISNMLLFLKNFAFSVIVPGTVAFYIPISMAAGRFGFVAAPPSWTRLVGVVPILSGLVIYLWCVWCFARSGRGTPAPIDEPKKLIVLGPYRYARNPMYMSVLLVIIGWAVFFYSLRVLSYGFCVGLVFHLFVVIYEEPHLRRRFGESYEHYCRAVRRWIPGRGYNSP